MDSQRRMIDTAQFLRIGMDMHKAHLRLRNIEQSITLRRHFGHAPSDQQDQIAGGNALFQLRVGSNADFTGIKRMRIGKQHGAPERGGHRKLEAFGKTHHRGYRLVVPAGPTQNGHGLFGRPEQLLQLGHLCQAGPCFHRFDARHHRHAGHFQQDIFGQADHHRAGPALHGDMEGTRDDFGDTGGIVDLGYPFGGRAEKGTVIHFLKRAAFAHALFDLADKQDQRHAVMLGNVDAGRGIGGAGSACDHHNARTARQPRRRIGHHRCPAFLTADGDIDGGIMQRIQHGQIAFARHTKHMLDPLGLQGIDDQLSARPRCCHGAGPIEEWGF